MNGLCVRHVVDQDVDVHVNAHTPAINIRARKGAQIIIYSSGTRIKGSRNAGCERPLMRLQQSHPSRCDV